MEQDNVETIKYKQYTINIAQDESPASPDEWQDDIAFLVGYHSDFTVEKDYIIKKEEAQAIITQDYDDFDDGNGDFKHRCKMIEKNYHIFGLEAYIHSGVMLSIAHEGNFPDRNWDVSQLGLVLVSKENTKTRLKAKKLAENLIDIWNMYLSGNVYGYFTEESGDSCWGYYGQEGIKTAIQEAKDNIDDDIKTQPKRIVKDNYTDITLGELLSNKDNIIKRNAISILKQLQRNTV